MQKQTWFLEISLFGLFLFFLIPDFSMSYDNELFRKWALHIYRHGISSIYQTDSGYQPFYLYLLYLFGAVQESESDLVNHFKFIKLIPLCFDFLPLLLFYKLSPVGIKKRHYLFLIYNIAYFYNTLIWGQIDTIPAAFSLLALYFAIRKPYLGIIFMVLAFNTKVQAIIILPVFLCALLIRVRTIKTLAMLLVLSITLEVLLLSPFLLTGEFTNYINNILGSIHAFSVVSMNALNFWHLATPVNPINLLHTSIWLKWTYKTWGVLLFGSFSLLVLTPLFVKTLYSIITKKISVKYLEILFLTAGLLTLVFFFFNVKMHERYSHPAILFLFFYSICRQNFLLYSLTSVAYFINLEKILEFRRLPYNIFIFNNKIIALIYLLVILMGVYQLYKNYNLKSSLIFISNNLFKSRSYTI